MNRNRLGTYTRRALSGRMTALGAGEFRFEACPFALWELDKQFICIPISNDKRWGSPLDHVRLDLLLPELPPKHANLVVVESDKHTTATRSIFRVWLSLIQNQLESEQADFKYECPALLFMLPLQRKA
jgi:hypothetical protein